MFEVGGLNSRLLVLLSAHFGGDEEEPVARIERFIGLDGGDLLRASLNANQGETGQELQVGILHRFADQERAGRQLYLDEIRPLLLFFFPDANALGGEGRGDEDDVGQSDDCARYAHPRQLEKTEALHPVRLEQSVGHQVGRGPDERADAAQNGGERQRH
jgi:hypothetical protein